MRPPFSVIPKLVDAADQSSSFLRLCCSVGMTLSRLDGPGLNGGFDASASARMMEGPTGGGPSAAAALYHRDGQPLARASSRPDDEATGAGEAPWRRPINAPGGFEWQRRASSCLLLATSAENERCKMHRSGGGPCAVRVQSYDAEHR